MSLDGTYSGLLSSLASWMDRDDLAAVIPDFVTLFESNANTEGALRTEFNRTSTVVPTTIALDHINTPADYMGTDTLRLTQVGGSYSILKPYGGASSLYTDYPNASTQGQPKGFFNLAGKLEIAPVPDAVYQVQLYYYQKIPALVTYSANWLLTHYPQVYLFGSLVAAEAFLGSDPRISTWGNLYDNAIQKIGGATDRNKYGGSSLQASIDAVA